MKDCSKCWNFDPKRISKKGKKPYCVKYHHYLEETENGWVILRKEKRYYVGDCKSYHKGSLKEHIKKIKTHKD
jgi:hypothetical protein